MHYTCICLAHSVPEFRCLDDKELLKIADVLQEVSDCSTNYELKKTTLFENDKPNMF